MVNRFCHLTHYEMTSFPTRPRRMKPNRGHDATLIEQVELAAA